MSAFRMAGIYATFRMAGDPEARQFDRRLEGVRVSQRPRDGRLRTLVDGEAAMGGQNQNLQIVFVDEFDRLVISHGRLACETTARPSPFAIAQEAHPDGGTLRFPVLLLGLHLLCRQSVVVPAPLSFDPRAAWQSLPRRALLL